MKLKWLYCDKCRRILKNTPAEIKKHASCRVASKACIRYAGDESFWHCFYRPELLADWARIKLEDTWRMIEKLKS